MLKVLAKVFNVPRDYVNNRSLAFQYAFDFEQAPLHDSGTIGFNDTGPNYHVNVIGFILQGKEQYPGSG
jgi:hypothetical protein